MPPHGRLYQSHRFTCDPWTVNDRSSIRALVPLKCRGPHTGVVFSYGCGGRLCARGGDAAAS